MYIQLDYFQFFTVTNNAPEVFFSFVFLSDDFHAIAVLQYKLLGHRFKHINNFDTSPQIIPLEDSTSNVHFQTAECVACHSSYHHQTSKPLDIWVFFGVVFEYAYWSIFSKNGKNSTSCSLCEVFYL